MTLSSAYKLKSCPSLWLPQDPQHFSTGIFTTSIPLYACWRTSYADFHPFLVSIPSKTSSWSTVGSPSCGRVFPQVASWLLLAPPCQFWAKPIFAIPRWPKSVPKSRCTVTISCSDYLQRGSKPDLEAHAGLPLKPLVSQEVVENERLTVHESAQTNTLSEVWRGSFLRLQMSMGFAVNSWKTFFAKEKRLWIC